MLMIGSTRLAQEVHAAWRDGMLSQGREVAPERMTSRPMGKHPN
jgi:hypothetical protein